MKLLISILVALGATGAAAQAAQVHVAVAANFTAPMQIIAAQFERDTGHKAILSFGATGKFYAQILNGAPFQVLLSADDTTPARLEQNGSGVSGSRFTYAIGKLVLWSKKAAFVDDKGEVLRTGKFDRLALADPKLAPYGAAAIETLNRMDLTMQLTPRFVQGENISQTFQFVATQNAPLGFVAMSQVYANGKLTEGSAWVVPEDLYSPIRQDAILLNSGKANPAAAALLTYLRSDKAKVIIRSFGYAL